ncbi:MAG: hypothetical protein LBS03_08955 [Bacteroidales bacterium]|jgi:hypothetical protein|nr:hypothetical protein [Bacteroidales bacterium]
MSKIAAFYYTQSGQGLNILRSVCRPLEDAGHQVVYKAIVPETEFPFPWTADAFFQTFPESYGGVACSLRSIDLSDVEDAAQVIVEYPVWFLSPSIPTHGFFQTPAIRQFLKDKNIITIGNCRNMWVKAHTAVNEYITGCGGKPAGSIVLQDRHHNLISVITIVRWLIHGHKEKKGLFPAAGVSPEDIASAAVFGRIINEAILSGDFSGQLQQKLIQNGAIRYKPSIVFIEKTGYRIFGLWLKFILRKGDDDGKKRAFRLKLFKYYLFAVLYLVSPVGMVIFYLTYPFRYKTIQKDKRKQCYLLFFSMGHPKNKKLSGN